MARRIVYRMDIHPLHTQLAKKLHRRRVNSRTSALPAFCRRNWNFRIIYVGFVGLWHMQYQLRRRYEELLCQVIDHELAHAGVDRDLPYRTEERWANKFQLAGAWARA